MKLTQFEKACQRVISSGDTVADVGCGVGVLGLLALKAGARHSYQIEEGPIIEVARQTFQDAGLSEKATFFKGRAEELTLPERVDVALCDHIGYLGFDYGVFELCHHVKEHYLNPGGTLLPRRVDIEVASVSSQELAGLSEGWKDQHVPNEFHWIGEKALNTKFAVNMNATDVISLPSKVAELALGDRLGDFLSWQSEVHIERDGLMHGLGAWFHCELAQDIWMTNSPLSENKLKRRQAFLPIKPMKVTSGQQIAFNIMVRPADNLLSWEVMGDDGVPRSYSTWEGFSLELGQLSAVSKSAVPKLNKEAHLQSLVLGLCDSTRTIAEIEDKLYLEHEDLFSGRSDVSHRVAKALSGMVK